MSVIQALDPASEAAEAPLIDLDRIRAAPVVHEPYTYIVAHGVVSPKLIPQLRVDFPHLGQHGFLPIDSLPRTGVFDQLVREVEGPGIAEVLTEKLGVELRDKPRIVTVRQWSEAAAGRIHVDGESKIVTSLIYLNETWPDEEDGGRFRVLFSDRSFDDCAAEIVPAFGTFVAFVRTDQSWHGHKPFVGERRVIQTAWLRSQADLDRKKNRGTMQLFLKNLLLPKKA